MKHIPILRTARLKLQLKPLSIGNAVRIASMPAHLEQAEATQFLTCAIESVTQGPEDPLEWTVQERTLAIAHYIASTSDTPNFVLSESNSGKSKSRYLDYLDGGHDYPEDETIDLGEISGGAWRMGHLLGKHVESIERLSGELSLSPRFHWIVGGMAAQLIHPGDKPHEGTDDTYDKWLLSRMKLILDCSEHDFEHLLFAVESGRSQLYHLFDYTFDADKGGLIILPREADGDMPPARFPVASRISKLARELAGKP